MTMTEPNAAIAETGTGELLCRIEDGVAVLTLNRPEARNALSDTLTPALRRKIADFSVEPRVRVVVITGSGAAFCAGGDVKAMGKPREMPLSIEAAAAELKVRQRTLTGAIFQLGKPSIAALPGPAAGAGLAIALACDIRIAADSAFVSTGYARVGLSGDYGINWLLTRAVGTARARELMFTAARVDAAECLRIGLVNRVVAFAELERETLQLAREIAGGPQQAIEAMKENLAYALTAGFLDALDREAELMVRAARTEDHKEAVAAFIEKRKPVFRNPGSGTKSGSS